MTYPERIETAEQAKEYIDNLCANGLIYHLEDSAKDVIFSTPVPGPDLDKMDILSDQIFKIRGFCPFDYILNHIQA